VATINAESKAIAMCRDATASQSEKAGRARWRSNATRSTPLEVLHWRSDQRLSLVHKLAPVGSQHRPNRFRATAKV